MNVNDEIFQEVISTSKYGSTFQDTLEKDSRLLWLIEKSDQLASCLFAAYDSMFNKDKSQLLYTVGYNGVFAGMAAIISYSRGTISSEDDLFEFLKSSFSLDSLYLKAPELIWPGEGYNCSMDRLLMNTDSFSRQFLPWINGMCEQVKNKAKKKSYMLSYVRAMILYGGYVGIDLM